MIKTIVYTSNNPWDRNLYPSNKNSKFTTLLNPELLHYIPNVHEKFTTKVDSNSSVCGRQSQSQQTPLCRDGELLTIALKSIAFPRPSTDDHSSRGIVIGLRSNISSQTMLCNANYDKLIALFMVQSQQGACGQQQQGEFCTVEIDNPVFYPSTWPLLCNPTFELVEIQTNSTLTMIDPPPQPPLVYNTARGSIHGAGIPLHPTVIEIMVKMDKTTTAFNRQMPPFNAVLVSSDSQSKAIHQDNTNTRFTVHLVERQDLQAALLTNSQQPHQPQWHVVLKSIQLSSRLYNIPYKSKDYWFSYLRIAPLRGDDGGGDSGDSNGVPGGRLPAGYSRGRQRLKKQELKAGYYPTPQSLLDQINKQMQPRGVGGRKGFPVGKFVLDDEQEEEEEEGELEEEEEEGGEEGELEDEEEEGGEEERRRRRRDGGAGAKVKFLVDWEKLKQMEEEMMEGGKGISGRRRELAHQRKQSRSRQLSQNRQQQQQGSQAVQVIRPKNVHKNDGFGPPQTPPAPPPPPPPQPQQPAGGVEPELDDDEDDDDDQVSDSDTVVGDSERDDAGVNLFLGETGEEGGGEDEEEEGEEEDDDEEVIVNNVGDFKVKHFMKLSPKLAELLGFIKLTDLATATAAQYNSGQQQQLPSQETMKGIFRIDLVKDGPSVHANYAMNLNLGRPRSLLICSNIVGKTNVGKRMVPLLRLLNLPGYDQATDDDVMSFEFRHNCLASVDTMYFDAIHIYMTDLDGNPVLAEDNYPSILHLMFVNL